MMKRLKKFGNAVLTGIIRVLLLLPAILMRILYRGHIIYTDPKVKDDMKRGAVLICDHKNHLDGFFAPMMLFPRKVYVLITRKWYDKKFLKPIFQRLRYIPIDLQERDASWMAHAETVLKKGQCVLIFPEGKLEKNGVREPFQSGFLLPVRHLNVPVIPMAITGDYRIFRRQTLIVGKAMNLELKTPGRLSAVLNKASEQCEREVFALADGKIPDE